MAKIFHHISTLDREIIFVTRTGFSIRIVMTIVSTINLEINSGNFNRYLCCMWGNRGKYFYAGVIS